MTLIGDFHTLRQSQREVLRILREVVERQPSLRVGLAMECFRSADQKHLDDFCAQRIDADTLFIKTKFDQTWGFPHKNYQMLIDFAQSQGIPLIGINTDKCGQDPIKKRDLHSATILHDWSKRFPKHHLVVMIGEYHLADDKLPAAIERTFKLPSNDILRIVTNTDKHLAHHPEIFRSFDTIQLKLAPNLFSIFNTSPWLKWTSALHWEEFKLSKFHPEPEEFDSDEDYNIFDFDFDHLFLRLTKEVSDILGFSIGDSILSHFTIVNLSEITDLHRRTAEHSIPRDVSWLIEQLVTLQGAFVYGSQNLVFIKTASFNSLAIAVGQFLANLMLPPIEGVELDYRTSLQVFLGRLTAKILNPKIKLNRQSLKALRSLEQLHRQRRSSSPSNWNEAALIQLDACDTLVLLTLQQGKNSIDHLVNSTIQDLPDPKVAMHNLNQWGIRTCFESTSPNGKSPAKEAS
jgi:hypothetical protein